MYKITGDKLLEITNLLERGHTAINALERLSNNKRVYLELKKEMQDLSDELESRYMLKELRDPEQRLKYLNKLKKEADDNWSRYQEGI